METKYPSQSCSLKPIWIAAKGLFRTVAIAAGSLMVAVFQPAYVIMLRSNVRSALRVDSHVFRSPVADIAGVSVGLTSLKSQRKSFRSGWLESFSVAAAA